jgi:hypothetical protein
MTTYRSQAATFDRDKQLFQRNQTDSYYQTALNSANQTFALRSHSTASFNAYLAGLLDQYVTPADQLTSATLKTKLNDQLNKVQALPQSFTDSSSLYRTNDDFVNIFASLNETAYQSFAQIYFHELQTILTQFQSLYDQQNQRILDETTNQIERENKNQTLGKISRALQSLATKLTQVNFTLSPVNSRDSYFTFRSELNNILTELESNLKLYAGLE